MLLYLLCLFDLACFFLSSHLSFKNMYLYLTGSFLPSIPSFLNVCLLCIIKAYTEHGRSGNEARKIVLSAMYMYTCKNITYFGAHAPLSSMRVGFAHNLVRITNAPFPRKYPICRNSTCICMQAHLQIHCTCIL